MGRIENLPPNSLNPDRDAPLCDEKRMCGFVNLADNQLSCFWEHRADVNARSEVVLNWNFNGKRTVLENTLHGVHLSLRLGIHRPPRNLVR
jgi:hypothetical protein